MDWQQVKVVEAKYQILAGRLDEATLRLWAAVEARSLGRGGVSLVARAVGLSRTTIHAGLAEIDLYRAVDRAGHTIDFLLRAHRDLAAAWRFLERAIDLHGVPDKITIDQSGRQHGCHPERSG
jgi:putative transposase